MCFNKEKEYVTSDKTEKEPFIKLLIGTEMELLPLVDKEKSSKANLCPQTKLSVKQQHRFLALRLEY